MKHYEETYYVIFCFTESMIHMHLFHPVLFGCANQVGFLNVQNLVLMSGTHTSACDSKLFGKGIQFVYYERPFVIVNNGMSMILFPLCQNLDLLVKWTPLEISQMALWSIHRF